jgi:hypothetical protein
MVTVKTAIFISYLAFALDRHLLAAMSDALQREKHVCMPVEVKVAQAVDVVMNYLRDHPEQRNYNAMSLGEAALAPAFPCK